MKSRTSFCKDAALFKDLGRFWPVWVGYTLFLLLLQILQSNNDLTYWYAANMGERIAAMAMVNLAYAMVTAQMLFGDLFSSRMCNGLHALPLRREKWFAAHIQAGFLFSLVPTAITLLFSEAIIRSYSNMVDGWLLPLFWWVGVNLQYVFFFGLAVFCVMCAGNRFAALVIYGILNFLSLLAYLLADQLYAPLLFGVVTMSGPFELLCPVYKMVNTRCIDADRVKTGGTYIDTLGIEQQEYYGTFEVTPEGWIYILVTAVIGIALLVLARRMYRRRRLECAGDFLAVGWLEPVFQVVFTVVCAAAFHGVCVVFFGLEEDYAYLLMGTGLLAGWFAGRMLLERTTRVFRMKTIAGFALLAAVMAGSLQLAWLDPLDVEGHIPAGEDIQSVSLRMNYRTAYVTEDPEEIEDLRRLHALALEQALEPTLTDDAYYSAYNEKITSPKIILQYTASNGWLTQRSYHVSVDGESGELLRKYCSRLETVLQNQEIRDLEDLKHSLRDCTVITVDGSRIGNDCITEEFLNDLAEAIVADAEAGNLVQSGSFHQEPLFELDGTVHDRYYVTLDFGGEDFWSGLVVYADCENILAVLQPTGVLDQVRQELDEIYG